MEVGGSLAEEGTVRGSTLLRRSQSLEALLNDGRIFAMVVGVHLHVGRADVHFITGALEHIDELDCQLIIFLR